MGTDAMLAPNTDGATADAAMAADAVGTMDMMTARVDAASPPSGPKNILLLIADDLGLDAAACYGVGQNVARTPNIQSLCDRGVVFRNAWVNPFCSATRATMLTGRYGFRTGVGRTAPPGVEADELTLPRALDAHSDLGYQHASLGKWHLGTSRGAGNNSHPNEMGWGHFSGILTGGLPDYFDFVKVTDGQAVQVDQYATTDMIDDAITWLDRQDGPWFLWVAFNAPHSPFHLPPEGLFHVQGLTEDTPGVEENPLPYYKAAIEAMDTEMGRLFEAIGPEEMAKTHVIYLGDNGTPSQVVQAPFGGGRAKGSIFNGGVHVPMVIAGPAVSSPGRDQEAVVNGVDIYATILELAGVDVESAIRPNVTIDSVSMVPYLIDPDATPRRNWIVSELFSTRGGNGEGKTMRDARYKIIRFSNGAEAFYDLSVDPYEGTNLLASDLSPEHSAAYESLGARLTALLATEQ